MLTEKQSDVPISRFAIGEGRPLKMMARLAAAAGAVGMGMFGVAAGYHAVEAASPPATAYEMVKQEGSEELRDDFLALTIGAAGLTAAGVALEIMDSRNRQPKGTPAPD